MRNVSALCLVVGLIGAGSADAQKDKQREGNLNPGDAAPGFTVKDVEGKKSVTLSDLKGKPVVLIFGSCT